MNASRVGPEARPWCFYIPQARLAPLSPAGASENSPWREPWEWRPDPLKPRRIFANSYRKSFVLCATHDYSSHVAACRINNLQLEFAKIRPEGRKKDFLNVRSRLGTIRLLSPLRGWHVVGRGPQGLRPGLFSGAPDGALHGRCHRQEPSYLGAWRAN